MKKNGFGSYFTSFIGPEQTLNSPLS